MPMHLRELYQLFRTRKYHVLELQDRLSHEAICVQAVSDQLEVDAPRLPDHARAVVLSNFATTKAELLRAAEELHVLQHRASPRTLPERLIELLRTRRTAGHIDTLSSLLDDVHASINDVLTPLAALPLPSRPPLLSQQAADVAHYGVGRNAMYDVFISHAAEDKYSIALPLYNALRQQGIAAFVDEMDLVVMGDNRTAAKEAMATVPVGVFVLSPEFAAKKLPMLELMCFQCRGELGNDASPEVLPVFYRLSIEECVDENLFDARYPSGGNLFSQHGFFRRVENGEVTMQEVKQSLRSVANRTGVVNVQGAANEDGREAADKRGQLVELIVQQVAGAVDRTKNRPREPITSKNVNT